MSVGVSEQDIKDVLAKELNVIDHKKDQKKGTLQRVRGMEDGLMHMFVALPRDEEGRFSHDTVRYALHRFFTHKYGWFIRGLEPTADAKHGSENPGGKEEAKEWVPSFLQDEFEHHFHRAGSDRESLVALGMAIQDLVRTEVGKRLEAAYQMHNFSQHASLSLEEATNLIDTYYVGFLNSGKFSASSPVEVRKKRGVFWSHYDHAAEAQEWLANFMKEHTESDTAISFEELQNVAFAIGEEYVDFNNLECKDLKKELRSLEGKKPGRVRLSAFYLKGMHSHWAFTEKKEYLRDLGVLDESDPEQPSVIIANYAMSRSNCLDASKLYTICCQNECEEILSYLEMFVGMPSATVEHMSTAVTSMKLDGIETMVSIPQHLQQRLEEIAAQNGDHIPLHGRLFGQWLHHAFPLNCPYPHETGTINPQTPDEWIKRSGAEQSVASDEEIKAQIDQDTCSIDDQGKVDCGDEGTAELSWNSKEELLTYYPQRAATPRQQSRGRTVLLACAFLAVAAPLACIFVQAKTGCGKVSDLLRQSGIAWRPLAMTSLLAVVAYSCGLLDVDLLLCSVIVAGVMCVARQVSFWKKQQAKKCADDPTAKCMA